MTKLIKKSFLIDPLTTNNTIYHDSLTFISNRPPLDKIHSSYNYSKYSKTNSKLIKSHQGKFE